MNVKPSPTPSLDVVREFDVKVSNVGTDRDNYATYDERSAIAPEIKKTFPQTPVGRGPEETFTQRYENRYVQNRVGSKMMKLNAVNKKKSADELVDRRG